MKFNYIHIKIYKDMDEKIEVYDNNNMKSYKFTEAEVSFMKYCLNNVI